MKDFGVRGTWVAFAPPFLFFGAGAFATGGRLGFGLRAFGAGLGGTGARRFSSSSLRKASSVRASSCSAFARDLLSLRFPPRFDLLRALLAFALPDLGTLATSPRVPLPLCLGPRFFAGPSRMRIGSQ
jgi:hypothetical protein